MVRLILLAAAWLLMRRYIFRRRTRIERDTLVARLTQKLRALAKATSPRSAATASALVRATSSETATR